VLPAPSPYCITKSTPIRENCQLGSSFLYALSDSILSLSGQTTLELFSTNATLTYIDTSTYKSVTWENVISETFFPANLLA